MLNRRVVITGLGAVSPLGNSIAENWANVSNGKSGIGTLDTFDTSGYPCRFAGLVKNFNSEEFGISTKDTRKMDVFIQYGMAAAAQAMQDSGLEINEELAPRAGVCIGSGIGGLPLVEKSRLLLENSGPRKVSPFFIPGAIINMISGNVSIRYNLQGPNLAIVTACTTGTHSIGTAARHICYGDADVMLAGGSENASCPLGMSGFAAARALSLRNDDPERASRPWDKDRDGFVLSDGAAVLVLEEYEHAKKRGAKIYAELVGYGLSGDAYHITQPSTDGAARSMAAAMQDAKIDVTAINYINAHATSTMVGDSGEVTAVKKAFGDYAYKLAMSSTKSMTGHLLGAAGAIEAIYTVLAIHNQVAPPTINLDEPSEGCDLDFVPHTAREMPINYAMSNSFGFGGTNGTLIFGKI